MEEQRSEEIPKFHSPEWNAALRSLLGDEVPEDALIRWKVCYKPLSSGKRRLHRLLHNIMYLT